MFHEEDRQQRKRTRGIGGATSLAIISCTPDPEGRYAASDAVETSAPGWGKERQPARGDEAGAGMISDGSITQSGMTVWRTMRSGRVSRHFASISWKLRARDTE
jgi:hypothetical protein